MKAKISLLTIFALLLFAQVANATSFFADTRATAYAMSMDGYYIGKIDSHLDADWFTYKNNTAVSKVVEIGLQSPPGTSVNYDFDLEYCTSSGACTSMTPFDYGAGQADYILSLNLPPGYYVYWKVRGHSDQDYSSTYNYHTSIHGY